MIYKVIEPGYIWDHDNFEYILQSLRLKFGRKLSVDFHDPGSWTLHYHEVVVQVERSFQ